MEVEADRVYHRSLSTFTVLCSTLIAVAMLVAVFLMFRVYQHVEMSTIRIANDTGLPLRKVHVNGVPFGDVPVNGVSRYQPLTPAFRYASLRLEVADQKFESVPDDYVGEKPLGKGNFTYRIRRESVSGVPYFDIQVRDSSPD